MNYVSVFQRSSHHLKYKYQIYELHKTHIWHKESYQWSICSVGNLITVLEET